MTWTKEWDGASIVIHGEDRKRVCLMATGSSPEQANLIAAAPDLAEALEGVLGLAQLLLARDDLPADVREALESSHRIDAARAALAKARGE